MKHAVTEHRDFRMLEVDYVASGGALADIQGAEKNIGSEALSACCTRRRGPTVEFPAPCSS
jgi:3-oxoacyl-[acyl-carrier-protein] synthase-3